MAPAPKSLVGQVDDWTALKAEQKRVHDQRLITGEAKYISPEKVVT